MKNTKTSESLRNAVILLGSTMSVMAGASIAPALPEMSRYFSGVENAEFLVKIMLTVPSLFIALFSPLAGIIFDKCGRKIPLVFATALYGISGVSGFFLDNLYLILAGRAFLGISVAFIMAGYITIIGDLFSGTRLNKFMGAQAAFMSFGGVLFLAVSGALADIEWRHPFLIYLFAFMILPGIIGFLYETRQKEGYDENQSETEFRLKNTFPNRSLEMRSQKTDIDTEKSAGQNTSQKGLFRKEVFQNTKSVYVIAFIGMALFLMIPVQLPFLLKENSEISNTNVGLLMSLWILCSAVTSLFYRYIRRKMSFYPVFSLAFFLWSFGYAGLSLSENMTIITAGLILSGIGNGLVLPNTKVLLINIVPGEFRGRAVGVLTMAFYFGQFFSPMLFRAAIPEGEIQNGFAFYAGVMFVIAFIFFILRGRK